MLLAPDELDAMRTVCQLAAETLTYVGPYVRPGVTTAEINRLVHEHTVSQGARPAPLNYHGFPASVCTSVNDVVCHGIPSGRVLKDGDIINVDVTHVFPAKNGFFGDTSATFYVGQPTADARQVVEVARQCLEIGVQAVKPGACLGDIGAAIQAYARVHGCTLVREYTGHGIGRVFHGPPAVAHYGLRGTGIKLRPGMTFTVEPMVNLGARNIVQESDGWTVRTRDGSMSAQFEHTVTVTETGCEVLTARRAPLVHSETFPWVNLPRLTAFRPKP